jgi:hypothetical protein
MSKPTPESVSTEMQRYYSRAYESIMARLHFAKKGDNYWKSSRQAQLLKQVAVILDKFKASSGNYLTRALHRLAEYETKLAAEDLSELKDAMKKSETWHAEYNEKYVVQVFQDCFTHIAGQTDRMKQSIKADLRKDAQEIFRRSSIDGTSRAKTYRTLRDTILSKSPDFKFIDKAGRKWDSKVYFDMMTKTVMAQTQRDIYANTLANEGHDLVKITQNGAKDACRNWEGKILSLTGATKGYPTLDEVTATGEIFHPNCKHRFVAYDQEIDEFMKESK